ncbi:right-handed parallel beta-helix repeat-containing protein [Streptomyces sp. NPDC096012]|uniref:right-handed parallel beta-helix repeat-containing protein n=1 Tax=Streptomyces sp. NPDC096012 TaxID=3155684 RepID=UPI00336A211B
MPNRAALLQQAACCLGGAAVVLVGPYACVASASGHHGGDVRVTCSTAALISAIQTANTRNDSRLSLASRCTYHLTTAYVGQDGLPAVTSRISILGNDAIIQRDPSASGPFRILDVAAGGDLKVQNLTVKGGKITGQPELGAGIRVQSGGRLTLEHSRVSENSSDRNGGGVGVLGTATISDSELVANTATFGAGLVQFGSTAKTTISKSVIRFNVASFDGGGLEFGQGKAVVRDSQVDDNVATSGDGGGGIYNDADLQILGSTVDRNTAGLIRTGAEASTTTVRCSRRTRRSATTRSPGARPRPGVSTTWEVRSPRRTCGSPETPPPSLRAVCGPTPSGQPGVC